MSVALWVSALFIFLFKFFSILMMSKSQYVDAYGDRELSKLKKARFYYLELLNMKLWRFLKEAFLYYTVEEL